MLNYSTLSNEDLLRIIVREKRGENITVHLMKEFSSLPNILVNSEENELLQVKGIGRKRVQQLKAINELAKRLYTVDAKKKVCITSPSDVAKFTTPDLMHKSKEYFKILILNTKNEVISYEEISVGSLNTSIVHPREVFLQAIKKSAASIILVHNHPSGNPQPSKEDISITKRLIEAGKILGIGVLDHIIIAANGYVSLKEESLMEL